MICSITIYRDATGRVVEAHQPIPDEGQILPSHPPQYFAAIQGQVNTQMGPVPIPLKVPLDATTPREAFQVYKQQCDAKAPGMMREQVERMQTEARRQSLGQIGGG